MEAWRSSGYLIELIFLSLPSPEEAIRRVAARLTRNREPGSPADFDDFEP